MKKPLSDLFIFSAILSLVLASCGPAQAKVDRSNLPRDTKPKVSQTDLQKLVEGNTAFAFDFYQAIRGGQGNLVYSPYSLSLAFALAYAGARGQTAAEMAQVLHYALPADQFHPAFNALDLDLAQRPSQAAGVDPNERFQLNIANSLWGEKSLSFEKTYLDLLATDYGAGLRPADFSHAPDSAARQINDWVAQQTQERIKNLIPPGSIDSSTKLVLANAIYFKAFWEAAFNASLTTNEDFHLLDGTTVSAKTMSQGLAGSYNYAAGSGWQAVSLPYKGGSAEMVFLVPDSGHFASIEKDLNAGFFNQVVASMQPQQVLLSLPKFTFETPFSLSDVFQQMGMSAAFNNADFSGIDGAKDLFIGAVFHKAFIAVDEKGTEAAAATAILMPAAAAVAPGITLTIDRPFFFFIRDIPTGTVLFMGRVLDPTK